MIQLASLETLNKDDIPKLKTLIQPELSKRKALYKRYKRKLKNTDLVFNDEKKVKVPFEKYIIDIASGYLGGKEPKYIVNSVNDKEKQTLIKKILNKIIGENTYAKEMEVLIDYITNYNDDNVEHYNLVKNALMTSASYEIIYENEDNEIVYSSLSPLQTVAIWDYNIPANLVGLVRYYQEKDINEKNIDVIELIDKTGSRTFKSTGKNNGYELVKDENGNAYTNHNWGDVPAIAIEQEDGLALFEEVVELIDKYEQLVENTMNTFKYNDEAKLKVTGYAPQNMPTMQDSNGNVVENPDRKKEDEALLKAKVFYTPDKDGDIAWIEKTINDSAIQNTLKTIIDLVLMNTGTPNTTDLGFTKADNASAIDRKFFTLEQMTIDIMKKITMGYKRRWELIFNRINTKKKKNYDFRDVKIELQRNIPANENEIVDSWLKLRGLVSDDTIIDHLPYNLDSITEKTKVDEQENEKLEKDITKEKAFSDINNKINNAKLDKMQKNDIIESKKKEKE